MGLRIVGAGLGRTGTRSLKLALEQLLGAPCYHMLEVFGRPEHIASWQDAIDGRAVDWDGLFSGYAAAVDWPVASFWRELAAAYPDACILLSTRDTDGWWRSAHNTIFEDMTRWADQTDDFSRAWNRMVHEMMRTRFTARVDDEHAAREAYERHNDDVRASAPADRLVEWQPGDGWEPLCRALDLPVPAGPFPHVNSTAEFRAMAGLDTPQP